MSPQERLPSSPEADAMNAISRWGELASEERVTGHYKYSLKTAQALREFYESRKEIAQDKGRVLCSLKNLR